MIILIVVLLGIHLKLESTNHKYGKTMKDFTMDKKKALLAEVNKLS